MQPELNQVIRWRNCPPSCAIFATGRITEISECRQFVKFGFIGHWVAVTEIEPCDCPKEIAFCSLYQPIQEEL